MYKKLPADQTPSQSESTLADWSFRYSWPARAKAYDLVIEEARQLEFEKATQTGVATVAGRINDLKWLRNILKKQIGEQDESREGAKRYRNLWLREVKMIGSGEGATVEELWRFNSAIVEQFRGALHDLALETGGRNIKETGNPLEDDANYQIRDLASKLQGSLRQGE
jgi:hypothetical protein